MHENDVIERIKSLCKLRSWSYYRLAKESGITYSTLCTMLHKSNAPSITTLIKICTGFGISLSQFFDDDIEKVVITNEHKSLIELWNSLSDEQKISAEKYMRFLISEQRKI